MALGNALRSGGDINSVIAKAQTVAALRDRADHPSALVRERVKWALSQQTSASDSRPD